MLPNEALQTDSSSRWVVVPIGFFVLFLFALIVRWYPAAAERAGDEFGHISVIAGNIRLTWQALLRALVVFFITYGSLPWLPSVRWLNVICVIVAAVTMEILVEFAISALFGVDVGQTVQLVATGIGYATVLIASVQVIKRDSYCAT
jgi:hypothetical protein